MKKIFLLGNLFLFSEAVGTHTPYLKSGRHSATDLLDATRGLFCKVLLLRHAALYKQNSSTFIIALLSLLLWSQPLLEVESFICSNFLVEQILIYKFCSTNLFAQILLSIPCLLNLNRHILDDPVFSSKKIWVMQIRPNADAICMFLKVYGRCFVKLYISFVTKMCEFK